LGRADYLVVKRAATIRVEPDASAELLSKQPPESTLNLLGGDLTNGYYPVADPGSNQPGWVYKTFVRRYPGGAPAPSVSLPASGAKVDCSSKLPLRVRFYDVGQALAALVDLPDGRHLLVDAADSPTRAGCGTVCKERHDHLLERLAHDLNGQPISMLWITHQHSDHLGGAPAVLSTFRVEVYVDNGQDLGKTQVKRARQTAQVRNTQVAIVGPSNTKTPIADSGAALKLRPVVPAEWPTACEDDPNSCSIALRIDYCSSTILFTGDAEDIEEDGLDPGGQVTLLQVGHHGSDTSSSPSFLGRISPKYAVISAGKKGEGLNKTYCHPRQVTVAALTSVLGGPGPTPILAFDGSVSCRRGKDSNWKNVPASPRIWATSRDGDVTLTTKGDGTFVRE